MFRAPDGQRMTATQNKAIGSLDGPDGGTDLSSSVVAYPRDGFSVSGSGARMVMLTMP